METKQTLSTNQARKKKNFNPHNTTLPSTNNKDLLF